MEKELDFQSDVEIDLNHLEEEWLRQAELFDKYAKMAAQARNEWESKKHRTKVIKAQIELQIRRDPESFHLPKVTDAVVSAAVQNHEMVVEAEEEEEEARHRMDLCYVAKDAMEMKRDALVNEVKLFGQNYFATPFVKSDSTTSRKMEKLMENKGDSKVQKSLNRRRKQTDVKKKKVIRKKK